MWTLWVAMLSLTYVKVHLNALHIMKVTYHGVHCNVQCTPVYAVAWCLQMFVFCDL